MNNCDDRITAQLLFELGWQFFYRFFAIYERLKRNSSRPENVGCSAFRRVSFAVSATKRTTGAGGEFGLRLCCGAWVELGTGNEVIQGNVEDLGHGDQQAQAGSTTGLFVHAQSAGADGKFLG